jgi:hypothetical protein
MTTNLQLVIRAETEYLTAKANYQVFMAAEAAYEDIIRSRYPARKRRGSKWRSNRC